MKLENKLKEKLLNKKKVLGCWTSLDNEITSELLALVGFDFLLIDHEHGYGDVKGIKTFILKIYYNRIFLFNKLKLID